MKKLLLSIIILFTLFTTFSQTQPQFGIGSDYNPAIVIKNVNVQTSPTQTLENIDILILGEKIKDISKNIVAPKGAKIIDYSGFWAYPSFIDIYSDLGVKVSQNIALTEVDGERIRPDKYYWNDAIKQDVKAVNHFSYSIGKANEYLANGFGVVNVFNPDGIARGTGFLIGLKGEKDADFHIYKNESFNYFSFKKGNSGSSYPSSQMGAIALIRQFLIDAQWYQKAKSNIPVNISLDAAKNIFSNIAVFDSDNRNELLRAAKIANEFGLKAFVKGNGDEYIRAEEIKKTGVGIILPLSLPDGIDVKNPLYESIVEYSDLLHWEQAPFNPKILDENNINFVFTRYKTDSKSNLFEVLRKFEKYGLSKDKILAALTTIPAEALQMGDKLGKIQKGYFANFIITDKPIWDKESELYENWVMGSKVVIKDKNLIKLNGVYSFQSPFFSADSVSISGKPDSYQVKIKDKTGLKINLTQNNNVVEAALFNEKDLPIATFSGLISQMNSLINMEGYAKTFLGAESRWRMIQVAPEKEKEKKDSTEVVPQRKILYPFTAYGNLQKPKQEEVLFKNATVWTNESEGILKETDVWVRNGKIYQIGKNLSTPANVKVIDATGKHLTNGIIDEHSHIAINKGVNEGTTSASSEVRIGDVIDPDDINIYRHLAGGVCALQLLHGSANPIGGQSALIKLKWGYGAEEMKIANAPEFIKFALGENVKQSNWGNGSRYPQTRMGVEQIYLEFFSKAERYIEKKKNAESKKKNPEPFRRDLKLEAIAEILQGKRHITCHSYVQSEINMLMKLADSLGFKINTFTHILEGYKLAEKMKAHGAGASTFTDWWAYKMEVQDAIPYNAAILIKMGIITAINSDDAEMGRRLNQEAAKVVKYGGISEEEAWKTVTLNPAKLLRLDEMTGSIKKGKDADLVLWSNSPLSTTAVVEINMIDGIIFYEKTKHEMLHQALIIDKQRLINSMLQQGSEGKIKLKPPFSKEHKNYHCEDVDDI